MSTLRERISGLLARARGETEEGGGERAESGVTCSCGADYRVVGKGRHRVVWPAGEDQRAALTSSECPACGRPLEV